MSYAKTRGLLVTFSAALLGGVFVSAECFSLRQLAADGGFLGRIVPFVIPEPAGIHFHDREIP
ncbi:MAG TPA: hypothetical protein VFW42_05920 [Fluviicoccus sp.]|nr:hypothetical protein [Fluviicoccus sp.]